MIIFSESNIFISGEFDSIRRVQMDTYRFISHHNRQTEFRKCSLSRRSQAGCRYIGYLCRFYKFFLYLSEHIVILVETCGNKERDLSEPGVGMQKLFGNTGSFPI